MSIDCSYSLTAVNIADNSLIAVMAKNTNFVGARLSEEMKAAFDKYVSESGKKPTDVIKEAIGSYLNFRESKITIDVDWKTEIEDRLKVLEEQITAPYQLGLVVPERESEINNSKEHEEDNLWMTTREAHQKYASNITYDAFRKLKPKALLKRFNLQSELNRKTGRGRNAGRWLRVLNS